MITGTENIFWVIRLSNGSAYPLCQVRTALRPNLKGIGAVSTSLRARFRGTEIVSKCPPHRILITPWWSQSHADFSVHVRECLYKGSLVKCNGKDKQLYGKKSPCRDLWVGEELEAHILRFRCTHEYYKSVWYELQTPLPVRPRLIFSFSAQVSFIVETNVNPVEAADLQKIRRNAAVITGPENIFLFNIFWWDFFCGNRHVWRWSGMNIFTIGAVLCSLWVPGHAPRVSNENQLKSWEYGKYEIHENEFN